MGAPAAGMMASCTASVPVVFLTARGRTEHRIEGHAVGADAFLAKPFSPAELRAAIDRLNFAVPYSWGISIRDNSNASAEGFYGATARRCKLRITIQYYNVRDVLQAEKNASQNEAMTFGQVKSLYR